MENIQESSSIRRGKRVNRQRDRGGAVSRLESRLDIEVVEAIEDQENWW